MKSGIESPSWRGGTIRRVANYDWYITRREVLVRDNFTCQNCGYIGKSHKRHRTERSLAVHHINGYRYEKEDRDNLAKLTTLCVPCHMAKEWELHKKLNKPRFVYQSKVYSDKKSSLRDKKVQYFTKNGRSLA